MKHLAAFLLTASLAYAAFFPSTVINDPQTNKNSALTPMRELRTASSVRLVGANFVGSTLDSNFWTATVANSGTVTQGSGEVRIRTNTSANGSAILSSVRVGRYISSNANAFRGVIQLGDSGTANNVRRWGIMDSTSATDGAFFQLSGTTFSIVTRKNGSDTTVSSGSFNGSSIAYTPDTNAHTYEIVFTSTRLYFFIDDALIHTVAASTTPWAQTLVHRIYLSNTNSGGSTNDLSLYVRVATLQRYGEAFSRPQFFNNANVNETRVLKYGAGTLHSIVIGDPSSTGTITIYDNTAGSGSVIVVIDTSGFTIASSIDLGREGLDFNNGLTIVTSGSPGNFTVIYE